MEQYRVPGTTGTGTAVAGVRTTGVRVHKGTIVVPAVYTL